jgi:hypothetical protein
MARPEHDMTYSFDDHVADNPALPSDVTLRAPIYRRRGVIASLIATFAARASADRQLGRITRRYRRQPGPFDIPDYLREDIGLAPLPPKLPQWWEVRL